MATTREQELERARLAGETPEQVAVDQGHLERERLGRDDQRPHGDQRADQRTGDQRDRDNRSVDPRYDQRDQRGAPYGDQRDQRGDRPYGDQRAFPGRTSDQNQGRPVFPARLAAQVRANAEAIAAAIDPAGTKADVATCLRSNADAIAAAIVAPAADAMRSPNYPGYPNSPATPVDGLSAERRRTNLGLDRGA